MSIAAGIDCFLTSPDDLEDYTAAARARTFRTWPDYAAELTAWSRGLKRRN